MKYETLSRRQFLELTSLGAGALLIPAVLTGRNVTAQPELLLPENPFMDWYGIDEAAISRVMSELTSRGADDADAFFEYSRSTSFNYEDGIVNRASTTIDNGVGLRVVVGDQTGYAFTEDLSLEAMLAAARTAASIAHGAPIEPQPALHIGHTADYYPLPIPWSSVGADQRLSLIEWTAAEAMNEDPAVERVQIRWADQERQILLADINGQILNDTQPMTRLDCTITANRSGETQSNNSNIAARRGVDWYSKERLRELVTDAVQRTLILFDAGRPPAGEMPVVLSAGASGILLHEAIGHGMEADFNRKGISIYADMIGERIAPEQVTIIDDGTQPHDRGAINFDDEGTASQRTVLVEDGILVNYLHDKISARHYGVDSTGSGRRQSFRHPPMPRMRSTYMEDGPHTRDEIIASVEQGIYADTFTNGQVQIGAGDFTFYIKNGWMIEGGRLTTPIRDTNIIGNGPEVLQNVTMVANDGLLDNRGWICGKNGQSVPVSLGLPTVLVSGISVGGENA